MKNLSCRRKLREKLTTREKIASLVWRGGVIAALGSTPRCNVFQVWGTL